ncbi:MAG TPA: hypothetical protein VJ773_01750 [Gemmatimonadales bacterium]|nr:hypothetical protein [Gemmatimonadales bacterium]
MDRVGAAEQDAGITSPVSSLRHLDEGQVLRTIARLRDRISERFPGSGLSGVATALLALGEGTAARVERLKRREALAAPHELRSITHIVDMHQLTKDPDRAALPPADARSPPPRELGPEQPGRYLDHCAEAARRERLGLG